MLKIRKPSVAGYFYPGTKENLLNAIERFFYRQPEREKCISAICPHAGYIFSGATAGMVYGKILIPETVILIGPNHTGYGEPYAVSDSDLWETPVGKIRVDRETAQQLTDKSRYLEPDDVAHENEHALEVQVPFIQFSNPKAEIVPITLSGYIDNPAWVEIGEAVAKVIKNNRSKNIMIIASSDMTHYESEQSAEEKDNYALDAILALNEEVLIERIAERDISMCGYGPVITTIVASKQLGAKEGQLVHYTTSGSINKDYQKVVGYAGIVIK